MKLREALKATVARCTPLPTQPATFTGIDATGHATAVQQSPANPYVARISDATVAATVAQLALVPGATPAEKLQVAFAGTCNTQLGAPTAHRLTADLLRAAMTVCDRYDDGETARAEMRADCLALPPHLQADLLEHFKGNL